MIKHPVPFLSILLLCAAAVVVAQSTDATTSMQKYYTVLKSRDSSIFGANTVALDSANGIRFAIGMGINSADASPMTPSVSFRMNGAAELLGTTAVLQLISVGAIPFTLDAVIPPSYLPRGVTNFVNPNFAATGISMRMLLQHTSSLAASAAPNGGFSFDDPSFLVATPGPALSLTSFCNQYFATDNGAGGYTTQSAIWANLQPGLATSYTFSKANIALLAYIAEQAIVNTPTLVSSVNKTLTAYIQEAFFAPLGMTGSFAMSSTGSFPLMTDPYGSTMFQRGGGVVADLSKSGTTQAASSSLLHPVAVADYMYYTTALDLARFARALWLNGKFASVGTQMVSTSFTATTGITAQRAQGLGVYFFNGAQLCSVVSSSGLFSSCLLSSTTTVFGIVGSGTQGSVAVLCTTASGSSNPLCSVAQVSQYTQSTASSKSVALGFAAASLQAAFGSSSGSYYFNPTSSDPLDGFFVFLGVAGALIFIVVAAYLAEHLIQPAPVLAAALPPQPMPVPSYYPASPGPQQYSHYAGPHGGGGPPQMREYYD